MNTCVYSVETRFSKVINPGKLAFIVEKILTFFSQRRKQILLASSWWETQGTTGGQNHQMTNSIQEFPNLKLVQTEHSFIKTTGESSYQSMFPEASSPEKLLWLCLSGFTYLHILGWQFTTTDSTKVVLFHFVHLLHTVRNKYKFFYSSQYCLNCHVRYS